MLESVFLKKVEHVDRVTSLLCTIKQTMKGRGEGEISGDKC